MVSLKRTSFVVTAIFTFGLLITVLNKSANQYGEWWADLTSENGIREGQLVVVQNSKEVEPMLRVVHLDLKGAPPKLSYLRQVLHTLAQTGCNALLIEYEDMFPYHGMLANISAKNAYTQKQIMDILSWCHDLGIEVIPLVQTFGHLEFVLKLGEFRHLRELDSSPQELCPSNPDSLLLVKEMLRQVLSLHRSARYIHIGCDEVFHLAECQKCRHINPNEIFTTHVTQVAQHLKTTYPEITPLIWDDMMRQWTLQFLESSLFGNLVEPVVWAYTKNVHKLIPHYLWYWYTKTFKNIWIAGAFKGATSPTAVLPDIQNHYENQKSWLKLVANTPNIIKGYVLTGWSRYDHFAILCELLPPSFPSLLLNLITISSKRPDNHEEIIKEWRSSMKCASSSNVDVSTMTSDLKSISSCSFTGSEIYVLMNNYLNLKNRIDWLHIYLTERNAGSTLYNVNHNFTNPWRVRQDFITTNGFKLLTEVQLFKNEAIKVLSNYFDGYTIEEWIEQRLEPLEIKINTLAKQIETLMKIEVWPRRPLSAK